MLVADNGSDWYIGGAPNSGWSNDALHQLAASAAQTSRSSEPGSAGIGRDLNAL